MAEVDIQNPSASISQGSTLTEGAERVYKMSSMGRRQAFVLLAGVVSIWVFALWNLITILQDGVSGVEWVSLVLMLGILVVAPVVAWTLLEEANSRVVTTTHGITYDTMAGVNLSYSWDEIKGFKPSGSRGKLARFFLGNQSEIDIKQDTSKEAEEDDESDTLLLQTRTDHTGQIANPLVRFLHKQAHGSSLPIYGGLENRAELIGEIEGYLRVARNTVIAN